MNRHLRSCVLLAAVPFLVSCSSAPSADLVLRGGKVATVDEAFSIAQAVAVRDGRIEAVGSDADVEPYVGPATRVIDLDGRLVVPGLIDAHVHMPNLGVVLENLDLAGTPDFEAIVTMVADRAETIEPGAWILGGGWDQNDWEVKEFPTHEALTEAAPDAPVWLMRIDEHVGLANARAMEIAGITARTPDPEGGRILRQPDGSPTGVFIDNARALVEAHLPKLGPEQREKRLLEAAGAALAAGLTSVHDAGVTLETVEDYKRLVDADRLKLRVYAMLSDPGAEDLAAFLAANRIDDYAGRHVLTVRSMKLMIDGALGSRGAVLLEPYADDPGNTGLLVTTPERVLQGARAGLATGFQINTHAIGDRGNRLVLDAYEQALSEKPGVDHRFRIEHVQVVSLDDVPRFAALDILPSMQPTHATSDMYWVEDRVGPERSQGAYAWQRFLGLGLRIPAGSDFPVESVNPMLGIYAAITRQDASGWPESGWMPDQRMTREQVLRSFTIWAAYSAFQEHELGSIEVGKLADLVVLSADILTVPAREILSTVPHYTIVGGEIAYQAAP